MTEDQARAALDKFWTSVVTEVGLYFALVIAVLVLFKVGSSYVNRRRTRVSPPKSYDLSTDPIGTPDDPFAIAAPVIPTAQRPDDGRYFDRVLAFATEKGRDGRALLPIERLILGPLGLVYDVLKSGGFAQLDIHRPALPHKSWEFRQALEQIGLASFVDIVDRAIAVHQHRMQLFQDMTTTGMPPEQALMHPDMPRYEGLDVQLADLGGSKAFIVAADQYVLAEYPWTQG